MTVAALSAGADRVMLWCGLLILAALALGAVVLIARHFYLRAMKPQGGSDFSMESLRQMLKAGQICQEEFDALRRTALGLKERSNGAAPGKLIPPARQDDESKEDCGG